MPESLGSFHSRRTCPLPAVAVKPAGLSGLLAGSTVKVVVVRPVWLAKPLRPFHCQVTLWTPGPTVAQGSKLTLPTPTTRWRMSGGASVISTPWTVFLSSDLVATGVLSGRFSR